MELWVSRIMRIAFGLAACLGLAYTPYAYLGHKFTLGETICHLVVSLSLAVAVLAWGKNRALTEAMKATLFAGIAVDSWLHDGKSFYPTIFAIVVLFSFWRSRQEWNAPKQAAAAEIPKPRPLANS
jgi:hypothetical protein